MNDAVSKGLLSIEVNAPPIVAGTEATIDFIIRNPFPEVVEVDLLQAPSSAPLLPRRDTTAGNEDVKSSEPRNKSWLSEFASALGAFSSVGTVEVSFGSLVAEFPRPKPRTVIFNAAPNSSIEIKTPFGSDQDVTVNVQEGAEFVYEAPSDIAPDSSEQSRPEMIIPPQQESLASIKIKTAHWLLVKPKVLNLHALIQYRVNKEPRSQVVPVTISVQPPVKSIIAGTVSGSILGFLARQLNSETTINAFPWINPSTIVSILGIIVMATILSIVLSRQESSKGFVTLEDFYGAFVVGAVLGFTGTKLFEDLMSTNPAVLAQ